MTFEKVKIKIGLNALKSLNKSFEFPVEPKFSYQVRAMFKSSKVLDFSKVILNFPGFLYQNQGPSENYVPHFILKISAYICHGKVKGKSILGRLSSLKFPFFEQDQ